MTIHRFRTAAGVLAMLVLVLLTISTQPATAQEPLPQTVVPGLAAIWTDEPQYQIGQSIRYCYRIPIPGFIRIIDLPADGSRNEIYAGPSSGTGACQVGTVTPPTGTECLRLIYPQPGGGTGQTQTCFTVVGPTPPPPPAGVAISTDRSSYRIGDRIRVCYSVPAPGPITIIDMLANGQTQTLLSGYDDGTGGCIPGTVTPPAGTECLTLNYTYPSGRQVSAQTCFRVIGTTPPPPSDWTYVGFATVDSNGNWYFDHYEQISNSLTFVQVTSGTCGSNPASNLVWESNLQRQPQQAVGVSVWTGHLDPVGLAVSSGGSGYATLTRPVVPNPQTDVNLSLYGVGIVYSGTPLYVCLRAP